MKNNMLILFADIRSQRNTTPCVRGRRWMLYGRGSVRRCWCCGWGICFQCTIICWSWHLCGKVWWNRTLNNRNMSFISSCNFSGRGVSEGTFTWKHSARRREFFFRQRCPPSLSMRGSSATRRQVAKRKITLVNVPWVAGLQVGTVWNSWIYLIRYKSLKISFSRSKI